MITVGSIGDGSNAHSVLHKDLCHWIDTGIDYKLINVTYGSKLEVKENSKNKAAKKQS